MRDLSAAHVEAFLEMMSAERGAAKNTLISYEKDLDELSAFLKTRGALADTAGSPDLQRFLSYMAREGYKASSQARRLSAIRQFYKFLYAESIRDDDPYRHPRCAEEGPPAAQDAERATRSTSCFRWPNRKPRARGRAS